MLRPTVALVALAALSLLAVDPAPSYDPWAWLLWGRELAGGGLSTQEGPAFKPLPVSVCALLAPLGSAAPWLWVLLARTAALASLLLAFRLGRRLAGGSTGAGVLAATGVAFTGHFAGYAASGQSEGMLLALALAAAEAARGGRPRLALGCGVACALLRVETWPFLLAAAVVAWRRRPADRALLVAAAVLVPAAWLVPELLGSGDLLRSGARARVPNPGQPALADVPALAALREAVQLPLWPLLAGVGVLLWRAARRADGRARRALVPAAAGAAWMALVAAMAQAGFSGEPRYALPGAALISISGAAGVAAGAEPTARRAALVGAVTVALLLAAAPRADRIAAVVGEQTYQWRLQTGLVDAVRAAGGRDAVLACGQPYVGPLRGPLMAYRLHVEKHRVEPDRRPRSPGVVFRSALTPTAEPAPDAPPGFTAVAHVAHWEVFSSCGRRTPS